MKVTQSIVERWCRENHVKLVQRDDLRIACDEDGSSQDGLADCPSVWIKPFNQYSESYILEHVDEELPPVGECTVHMKCKKCGGCIDGISSKKRCKKCRRKSSLRNTKSKVNPLFVELERLDLDQLKRIAAENGVSSSGDKASVIRTLKTYLDLHGKFKRDLPKR